MAHLLLQCVHGGVSKTCSLRRARLFCSESKGARACFGLPERRSVGLRSRFARAEPSCGLASASTQICGRQELGLRHTTGRATNCARPTGYGCAGLAGARAGLVWKAPGSREGISRNPESHAHGCGQLDGTRRRLLAGRKTRRGTAGHQHGGRIRPEAVRHPRSPRTDFASSRTKSGSAVGVPVCVAFGSWEHGSARRRHFRAPRCATRTTVRTRQ